MEGLAASVLLIVILLGVLLIIVGLVYLLAQRLPKRSPEPREPSNRWIGIGGIVLVLLIIGLWAGIRSASSPQPQPAGPPPCPTGPVFVLLQPLC
jgi:uncharacterized BrkB/YihY/UPF0761 family membrane protein